MPVALIGLIFGIVSIFGSFLLEGGKIGALILIPAMMIVFGGTAAAAIIGTPTSILFNFINLFKLALFPPKYSFVDMINTIVEMGEIARREGILSLEQSISSHPNLFLKKITMLAIDGVEPEIIRESSENEIVYLTERHNAGAALFQKMGGYSPTMGIIGTVMGLISCLAKAGEGEASELVQDIATAFIATLWGVFMANIVWLPIADRLKAIHSEEKLIFEIISEGVISIQSGDNPRIISVRLYSMLAGKTPQTPEEQPENPKGKK
jgi:chemotaxis protein MotA